MSCLLNIFLFWLVIFYVVFHTGNLVERGNLWSKLEGIILSVDEDILVVSLDVAEHLHKDCSLTYFMKLPIFSLVSLQKRDEEKERLRKIKRKVKKERFKFKEGGSFAVFRKFTLPKTTLS